MVLGLTGKLFPSMWLLLLIPGYFLLLSISFALQKSLQVSPLEKILLFCIGLIWLIHFSGVLVPETGFDAVWYHLPIVNMFVQHGEYFYWREYYQSLNPFFSDGIFLFAYSGLGELSAKMVAYLFGLGLIFVSYFIYRQFLNRFWSLLLVLTVSSFQVVAWQASSFYVDVANAMWEVTALYFFLKSTQSKNKN